MDTIAWKLSILVVAAALASSCSTHAAAQNAADILAQHRRIEAQVNQCTAENYQHFTRAGPLAAQGIVEPMPQCSNYMPLWTAQMWQLEIAMARVNGDTRPACEIEYISGCENYRN